MDTALSVESARALARQCLRLRSVLIQTMAADEDAIVVRALRAPVDFCRSDHARCRRWPGKARVWSACVW
jgi:hypothetical protein